MELPARASPAFDTSDCTFGNKDDLPISRCRIDLVHAWGHLGNLSSLPFAHPTGSSAYSRGRFEKAGFRSTDRESHSVMPSRSASTRFQYRARTVGWTERWCVHSPLYSNYRRNPASISIAAEIGERLSSHAQSQVDVGRNRGTNWLLRQVPFFARLPAADESYSRCIPPTECSRTVNFNFHRTEGQDAESTLSGLEIWSQCEG